VLHLGLQRPRVEHHAIADEGRSPAHDPARQERQFVGLIADHERVSGVMAALEAHHHVGAARQPIDDLPLAFVAPLGADDGDVSHLLRFLSTGEAGAALRGRFPDVQRAWVRMKTPLPASRFVHFGR